MITHDHAWILQIEENVLETWICQCGDTMYLRRGEL